MGCLYQLLDTNLTKGAFLPMSKPIHVSDAEFQEKVLNSSTPVIVDFWAPWCGPCRMVAPILEELAKEYDGKIVVAKVNTDENPQWAMKYGVQGIPTMLFVKDGQLVDRMVGAAPRPFIQQRVNKLLEPLTN
jgi:thioredoxin 1